MKKACVNRKELFLKFTAVSISAMIVISSITMIEVLMRANPEKIAEPDFSDQSFQSRPCEVSSVLSQAGLWVSFDSSAPGTPAEAHVTISDTSGITIVADFHGFWRGKNTINGTVYDDLEMPGASSIQSPGAPVLPCLFEYVEIPHDVNVSIEVLASSSDITSGYNITPSPTEDIPFAVDESSLDVSSIDFGPIYTNDTFFPGNITSIEGGFNSSSLIMRGHRLLGLSFYPVQYNPVNTTLLVYSQIVIKMKYNIPAQIQPVADRLCSVAFERILFNILLNYDSCNSPYTAQPGFATTCATLVQGCQGDAEYLIITTHHFKSQADRLAEWKKRKGVPSEVCLVDAGDRDEVKKIINDAYDYGHPAPTYVLLLGDVEYIPTTYEVQHMSDVFVTWSLFFGDCGYIASDLGYFNVEGEGCLPDMIYGRMSVDTVEQAEIIVNKTLQYEQYPPVDSSFYNDALFAGAFWDNDGDDNRDGIEEVLFPFMSALERIRHTLNDSTHGYNVHINYSCDYLHYDRISDGYVSPAIPYPDVDLEDLILIDETLVSESLLPYYSDYGWLMSYDLPPETSLHFTEIARLNITPNINEGRFFVLYYGHGGSKNMVYPNTHVRDITEGWEFPFFNTSYFSDLTNENKLPLIISIACNTGWFDGETDQVYLYLGRAPPFDTTNLFSDYENECYAENITRLEGGGAVAAISSSRPAYAGVSAQLMDGLIQAFWPGFLESNNQPIYEMGAALIFGKLYAKGRWNELRSDYIWPFNDYYYPLHKVETTFEEYHLFGDPETQLWTETPTWINVSYPDSVGTANPQRFAVTVINSQTGDPINFAKVCIQQGAFVYEVRYTDPNGQAIFDVDPSADYSHINVTVTKHNVRPHIGSIEVIHSDASISVSPNSIIGDDILTITFNEYLVDKSKTILIDGYHIADLEPGITEFHWQVSPGPTRFMNVLVWSSTGSTVDCFQRFASNEGPDPWISHSNQAELAIASGEVFWDCPDIVIYRNSVEVDYMTQGEVHDIEVIVHNNGIIAADSTKVTLSYAPFGGGVSWTPIGEATVSPTQDMTDSVTFSFTPILAQGACLMVNLSHPEERAENKFNNFGYENVYVIEMSSPGMGTFYVGNPTNTTSYVYLKVTQLGNYGDVWNASILDYSSQPMDAEANETVTLFLDSLSAITPGEGRLFMVDIFIKCRLIGGVIFNASIIVPPPPPPIGFILLIVGGIVVAIYVVVKRRR